MADELVRAFREVGEIGKGAWFRGAPFWSWNDKLEPEELRRQIREFHQQGLGGFFMHARIGLDTPYMSEEWMQAVAACVDEAKKLGMLAWLYDEDKWPSGFAGGLVSGRGGDYNLKLLRVREIPIDWNMREFIPHDRSLAVYVVTRKGRQWLEWKEVTGKALNMSEHRGKVIVEFFVERNCYIDVMNPKAVEAFIRTTHDAYRERFAEEFGKTIPGIFTDEPSCNRQAYGWTEEFPREFLNRRGYDLMPHLPSLFYEVNLNGRDWQKVRHDYLRTMTELFVENFTKRVYEWCETNGLQLTGHLMAEDTLWSQIAWIGAAMPHYEFMQLPGIDQLGRNLLTPLTMKQCSSVARQFGRRVLSEMFGTSGWNASMEDQRWMAEWQFVLGVDYVCQHLCLYSLRGARKRDFPPSFLDHQPYWQYWHLVNNLFARTTFMLRQGRPVTDILVLHPISSAWCVYHPEDRSLCENLNQQLLTLVRTLIGHHYDFDFGDEFVLKRHGRIEDGKLHVGLCSYKVVIVPPSITWFDSTLELLEQFSENGGQIIAVEPLPERVNGEPDERIARFLKRKAKVVKSEPEALIRAVSKLVERRISISRDGKEATNIACQERDLGGGRRLFYIVNTERNPEEFTAKVEFSVNGQVQLWNAETGEVKPLPVQKEGDKLVAELPFASAQSYLLVVDERKEPILGDTSQALPRPTQRNIIHAVSLCPKWRVEPHELNALTLDYCDYRIDGGEWVEKQPTTWLCNRLIRKAEPCQLEVRFKVAVEELPPADSPLWLVIEQPQAYRIRLNGKRVPSKPEGHWLNFAFQRIDIRGLLKEGTNELLLECDYKPPLEVEAVYILGDFSVWQTGETEFVIRAPVREVESGNLVTQGFPFFAGSVSLSTEVELPLPSEVGANRVWLVLDGCHAIVAEVNLNGKECGTLAWSPYRLDVTKHVRKRNKLSVKLVGSLRNLLGPHHRGEDCLRGWRGSGTIFLARCNLLCVFCQNFSISHTAVEREKVTAEKLASIMLYLQNIGCHNINFVTPSHVVPQIVEALPIAIEKGLRIPIVYNTSAYDSLEALDLMDGLVDIYMPDFKFWDEGKSKHYLRVPDYPEVARQAIKEMHRQVGYLTFDENGLALRGVLIRHLVMPGCLDDTREILRWIATELGTDTYVNIMEQYYPAGLVSRDRYPEINRRITESEYQQALAFAREFGLWRLDYRWRRVTIWW